MSEKKNNSKSDFGVLQAMAITSALGMEMAFCVTLGFFAGRWLDNQYQTDPWLMVSGILLGIVIGIWGIINTLKRFW